MVLLVYQSLVEIVGRQWGALVFIVSVVLVRVLLTRAIGKWR